MFIIFESIYKSYQTVRQGTEKGFCLLNAPSRKKQL